MLIINHRSSRQVCATHLEEQFAKNPIRFVLEYGGKDDRNAIMRGLNVDRLLVPIMDLHQLPLLVRVRELLLRVESKLKWRCDGIALEQRHGHDKRLPRL